MDRYRVPRADRELVTVGRGLANILGGAVLVGEGATTLAARHDLAKLLAGVVIDLVALMRLGQRRYVEARMR